MSDDFLALDGALREFVDQDERVTLVLLASATDLVVPAKLLEAQGRQRPEGIYVLGVAPCPTVGAWLDAIMQLLEQQIEAANVLRADDQLPAWAPLPLACRDGFAPPAERMSAAAEHCDKLVPEPEPIVWVLLPSTCDDPSGYSSLTHALCNYAPWMDRHRFIVWDDRHAPALDPRLTEEQNEDAFVIELDFSAERQLDGLVQIASDESPPAAARMDALFQLAAIDFAYQRYPDALAKYEAVYAFDEGRDRTRQALCLSGAGDVAMQSDDPTTALTRYQSGLAIAVAEAAMPVVLPLLFGAGKACLALGRHEEAEGYFDYADKVASKQMDPFAKADALELRGVALQRGLTPEASESALASFESCLSVCERFGYETRWTSALSHQIAIYGGQARATEQRRALRRLDEGFERAAAATEAADRRAREEAAS